MDNQTQLTIIISGIEDKKLYTCQDMIKYLQFGCPTCHYGTKNDLCKYCNPAYHVDSLDIGTIAKFADTEQKGIFDILERQVKLHFTLDKENKILYIHRLFNQYHFFSEHKLPKVPHDLQINFQQDLITIESLKTKEIIYSCEPKPISRYRLDNPNEQIIARAHWDNFIENLSFSLKCYDEQIKCSIELAQLDIKLKTFNWVRRMDEHNGILKMDCDNDFKLKMLPRFLVLDHF